MSLTAFTNMLLLLEIKCATSMVITTAVSVPVIPSWVTCLAASLRDASWSRFEPEWTIASKR